MAKDLYEILGVSRGSSADEIQKAYREAARKFHPDLNPDDDAKQRFQEIQAAYEVLNDPEKRKSYDRYGSTGHMGGGGGPNPFQDVDLNDIFGGAAGGGGGFADIFRQFTQGGAGARRQRPHPGRGAARGNNVQHEILVSFHTAVLGGETEVSIQDGRGGYKKINIKVPAGIDTGKKIRVRGQGEPSPMGGEPGDLLVTVNVGAHPSYRRNGNDLELDVPITLTEAVLGAKVDVPTPKGTISLTVPPKTSSGKRLRVRGMGIELADGTKGDLFAEMQIVLPAEIDDEALELLKRIDEANETNPREDLKW